MLLKSEKYDRIKIEVALCLKLPRACKSSYAFRQDEVVRSYSEFYGTILFKEAACDGINYRTYIKTKNDLISYYNHFWAKKFIIVDTNLIKISYSGL